jgi:hypothetical protein
MQPVGYCIILGWVQYLDGDKIPNQFNPCRWKP